MKMLYFSVNELKLQVESSPLAIVSKEAPLYAKHMGLLFFFLGGGGFKGFALMYFAFLYLCLQVTTRKILKHHRPQNLYGPEHVSWEFVSAYIIEFVTLLGDNFILGGMHAEIVPK